MTARTLYRPGYATFRVNELQYSGSLIRAVVDQGANQISIMKVLMQIDEIATVDKDGNVLSVNKDVTNWELVDVGIDTEKGVDLDEPL